MKSARSIVALSLAFCGCESVAELPLRVVLPEDTSDIDDVDNLTLVLEPDGSIIQQATNGLEFSIEVEIPKDTLLRSTLYLARGSELRAWGRTPWFLDDSPSGLSLFAGRPGQFSTFPGVLDDPDPDLLAAALPERGLFMLESDGSTFLLSEYSLQVSAGQPLDGDPDHGLGGLFTVDGAVLRLAWGDEPFAARFDTEQVIWQPIEVELPGSDELDGDSPFALRRDDTGSRLFVYGNTETHLVDLEASPVDSEAEGAHDGPRPGARALALELADGVVEYLVFGSPDDRPVAWTREGGAFGPSGPWTGGACVQVDPGSNTTRVLCTGGLQGDAPVPDLLLLTRDDTGQWSADQSLNPLEVAMTDPLWLSDEVALYAQGEGQLVRIARDSLQADNSVSSAQRFAGGHSVQLPTGATFQVGGLSNEGQPLTRWQVFTPALQP